MSAAATTYPAGAVLFDLDGVLVDSEPSWYAVESALVERLGGVWGPEHQQACIGGTLDASCRYIAELTGTARSIEELRGEVLAEMATHFRSVVPVHVGAVELVDAVRARGVPTALVTSTYRVLADAVLDRLGAHRFDTVVTGDEVRAGKPDPEPYLTACARLGVPPASAVVVEDAPTGIRAAEAAGCVVVVVPSIAAVEPAARRYVVRSIAQVDPDWLLTLPD
jgi:HAD superfamily hydrolase (TIGR01509 family)